MASLRDHFERIVLISLVARPERRDRALTHLEESGMAARGEVTVQRAWPGDAGAAPGWWGAGNGAWGCLMSHVRAVQDALMDGVESVLILEDDIYFHQRAPVWLKRLMQEVPEWDQLYLGGQHLREAVPLPEKPCIWQAKNVNRTHAYALHRRVYARFLQHVLHAPDYMKRKGWHIDHQLGSAHSRGDWRTFTPAWWLCAQEEGSSSICGKQTPRMWWQPAVYAAQLPLIRLNASDTAAAPEWVYPGEPLSPVKNDLNALRQAIRKVATKALDYWKLPLAPPDISDATLRSIWPSGITQAGLAELAELVNYPDNNLFPHPLNQPVWLPTPLTAGFAA